MTSLLDLLVDTLNREKKSTSLTVQNLQDKLLILSLDLFLILDLQGKIKQVNSTTQKTLGWTREELQGQSWHNLIHPLDQELMNEQLKQVQETENLGSFESRLQDHNGEYNWFLFNLKIDSKKQLIYVVARNINEQKNAQVVLEKRVQERTIELEKANQLLQQEIEERHKTELALRESETQLKNKARELENTLHQLQHIQVELFYAEKIFSLSQVVAGIAHEINAPINFIYGNLEYLNKHINDLIKLLQLYNHLYPRPYLEIKDLIKDIDLDFILDDLPHLLDSMKSGAEKINKMVFSLRNFAHHHQADQKFINLHDALDSVLQMLQYRLMPNYEHLAIQIHKNYAENLPLVECYVGQLNQVLLNLFNNAIDAIEDDPDENKIPQITITTELIKEDQLPTQVIIKIKDNGLGIAPEIQNQIFDPFFTTKAVGKGTGLGLSISQQIIVEQHHGELSCISELGKGTELIITLPIKQ